LEIIWREVRERERLFGEKLERERERERDRDRQHLLGQNPDNNPYPLSRFL
jgi:hypothetical protein